MGKTSIALLLIITQIELPYKEQKRIQRKKENCATQHTVCFPAAYLLTEVTTAEKGISHAYILMILMPDTTSFMMRILWSASTAVLLLGGPVNQHNR